MPSVCQSCGFAPDGVGPPGGDGETAVVAMRTSSLQLTSVRRGYDVATPLWLNVAVGWLAVLELDLVSGQFLIGNRREHVLDAIETRSPGVIGVDHVPRRELGVGCSEHRVSRPREVVPT